MVHTILSRAVPLASFLALAACCCSQPYTYLVKQDFTVGGVLGYDPQATVSVDAEGDIFGTTALSGSNASAPKPGQLWEITASGDLVVLHVFSGTIINADGKSGPDGGDIQGQVLVDGAGDLFGNASAGGPNVLSSNGLAAGMVWEYTASGAYKDLHDFGGTVTNADGATGPDGTSPMGSLYRDASGNLFGIANFGGPNKNDSGPSPSNGGVLWEITSGGVYKDLHDFGGTVTIASGISGPDGQCPVGGVSADTSGNLYGTADLGGPNNASEGGDGMVWEFTSAGAYLDLHDFGGTITLSNGKAGPDGSEPQSPLVFDSSGDMYGTANMGGGYGGGLIWKMEPDASYVDFHDFGGTVTLANGSIGGDGEEPLGPIAIDGKGNVFGTTFGGALNNASGNVWEYSAAGKYVDLHDFGGTVTLSNSQTGTDGDSPIGLTLDSKGDLYGACDDYDEDSILGMVWELGPERIVNLSLSPSAIGGLGTTTGTVSLYGPSPAGGYKVSLNAGASGYLNLPSSVTVAAGETSATFTIAGTAQRSATINMGIIATGPYTYYESILTIQGDKVTGLSFSPSTIGGSGSSTATVTISTAAPPGGWIVHPTAAASGYLSMPSTVTVPAGATSTTFTITGANQRTGTAEIGVIASDGNASVESILTVQGDSLKSISLSPTSIGWSGTSTGTVTLNSAAPEGGWVVNLRAGAPGYLSMPSSVTIPAGATSATFSVTGASQRTASATIGVIANDTGNQVEADLTLTGDSLSGVSVSPTSVAPGGGSTGTVTLTGPAPVGGWVVKIWAGAPTDVRVPASVTVPAGQTTATFAISTPPNAVAGKYGIFANDGTSQFETLLTVT